MMNINASNQIYVSSASVDSRGAVKIVSTGAQASNTESYSGHVPTVSAMQAYLSGAYQKSLSSGTGITITDGATVSVNYGSPIVADGSSITVQKAALGSLGVVKTASDYTGIGDTGSYVFANIAVVGTTNADSGNITYSLNAANSGYSYTEKSATASMPAGTKIYNIRIGQVASNGHDLENAKQFHYGDIYLYGEENVCGSRDFTGLHLRHRLQSGKMMRSIHISLVCCSI